MEKKFKVFTINPGSTSTKVALFENETEIFNGKGFTTINKGTLFKNCHKNIKKYQKNLCKI